MPSRTPTSVVAIRQKLLALQAHVEQLIAEAESTKRRADGR
jgi:hypothetical protein